MTPENLRRRDAAASTFIAKVAELGGRVIGEYINSNIPVDVVCRLGHPCRPFPCNVTRKGQGLCKVCAGNDRATAEAAFLSRVQELGGRVLGKYISAHVPVEVECSAGHLGSPQPSSLADGNGLCLQCYSDPGAFYVVAGPDAVKFGITSRRANRRLWEHRRDGYNRVIRLYEGLDAGVARSVESEMKSLLKIAGVAPVRGREYFPLECENVILYMADNLIRSN